MISSTHGTRADPFARVMGEGADRDPLPPQPYCRASNPLPDARQGGEVIPPCFAAHPFWVSPDVSARHGVDVAETAYFPTGNRCAVPDRDQTAGKGKQNLGPAEDHPHA